MTKRLVFDLGKYHAEFTVDHDKKECTVLVIGADEKTITWAAGGTSHYFRDPDGHLVELASPGVWAIY